jgi:hypothetical protein
MGESERAVPAQAVPAITRSDTASDIETGVVVGEIVVDPTVRTPADTEMGSDPISQPDKVAKQRGMRPLTRP